MIDWLPSGTEDDVRPRMFAARAGALPFALATISEADGGPRPAGSQMVVTHDEMWGFLSGGCIETDVALHAREVLRDGEPRALVYGRGSPFVDMRLPCGSRLEILVERILPHDESIGRLEVITEARTRAIWESNGFTRSCRRELEPGGLSDAVVRRFYQPAQRLAVIGSDPFAIALAAVGARIGWDTVLVAPYSPSGDPPFGVRCDRRPLPQAFEALLADAWTAVAVATHDPELDHDALMHALSSNAGYVGVVGSRRKIPERVARLEEAGFIPTQIDRVRAPIGLPINARSPWEVAIAVVGEVIAARNMGDARPVPEKTLTLAPRKH